MSTEPHQHQQGAPPPQYAEEESGMSGGMKVALIIVGFGAFFGLLCCGGGVYLFLQADFEISTDPERTVEVTEQIAHIDIPEEFEPDGAASMDIIMMQIDMAYYVHRDSDSKLMIGDAVVRFGVDSDEVMEEARGSVGEEMGDDQLRVTSREQHSFQIRGESVDFEFAEAEHRATGEPYREIAGLIPTDDERIAFLVITVEEDYYDEDQIVGIIESIR